MSFYSKSKLFSNILQQRTKLCNRTFFGFGNKKIEERPFVVLRARRQEYPTILEMMWKYYYPDEPTVAAMGLGHKYNPIFDETALKLLTEGYSFVAKCSYTGDIVGACINSSICPWDPDMLDKMANTMKDDQLRQLFHFYAHVQRAPQLWTQFCTSKIFEMSMVFVRREDRKRGVCKLLLNESRKLGADCGYSVVRCDATNEYTKQTCEKLKMKMVYSIPYCSYTGSGPARGPLINAPPPHTGVFVFVDLPLYQFNNK